MERVACPFCNTNVDFAMDDGRTLQPHGNCRGSGMSYFEARTIVWPMACHPDDRAPFIEAHLRIFGERFRHPRNLLLRDLNR